MCDMSPIKRYCSGFLLATGLMLMISSCAVQVRSGRVFDADRSDYHTWDDHENGFYNQWVVETHRPHRNFEKLQKEDQRQYWQWRHDHPDK
jgi:hypothetical protein